MAGVNVEATTKKSMYIGPHGFPSSWELFQVSELPNQSIPVLGPVGEFEFHQNSLLSLLSQKRLHHLIQPLKSSPTTESKGVFL